MHEYFLAIKETQVLTDYHLDRLEGGINPDKRRRVDDTQLRDIVSRFSEYDDKLEYLRELSKHFGHVVKA